MQVPWDKREQLLIKGGLDPKKDLLNLTLRYDVRICNSLPCCELHSWAPSAS